MSQRHPKAGDGEKGTCAQMQNLPEKTGYLTCLYSGATLHSWFLGVSTVPESCSFGVLIRIELLPIFEQGERRASQLED